ncbi:MAG: DUF7195 family protein [Plesiomonas sp.]
MKQEMTEKKVLKLEDTVVCRKVPMTARGCDMLRSIRDHQVKTLRETRGVDYDVTFPVSIHMMMTEYCKLKNIQVH